MNTVDFSDDNVDELKQRVYDFIDEWYTKCKPLYDKHKWADPRYKSKQVAPKDSLWLRGQMTISDNHWLKNSYRNKIVGKIRKYTNYWFENVFGGFTLRKQKVDLTSINKIDLLDKRIKVLGGLPLQENSVCKLVGIFEGTIPSFFNFKKNMYCPDQKVREVFYEKYPDNFDILDVIIPGSWMYNQENLRIMASEKSSDYTIEELVEGYFSRRNIDLILPRINYYNPDIIDGLLVKPEAFSGILTSKMIHSKRKVSSQYTKVFAKDYINKVIRRFRYTFDYSLSCIGGREKHFVADLNSRKPIKSRMIIMGEDIPQWINQSVARPITKAFQRINDGFNFIGRSLEQRNYAKVADSIKSDLKETICFNADFSTHDNYVSERQIVVAFALLRLCYPKKWKFMDKLFFYFVSSFVYKHIVLPESGFIYRISKGIPSGHAFTSIINTLCAYGTFATAINNTCWQKEINQSRIYAAGDDIIGRLPLCKVISINDNIQRKSGMKIDDISSHCGPLTSSIPKYGRTFLKKKFTYGLLSWNDSELVQNLYNSTSGLKHSYAEIERIMMTLMNGPGDINLNRLCEKLVINHLKKPRFSIEYKCVHPLVDIGSYTWERWDYNKHVKKMFPPWLVNLIVSHFRRYIRLANKWFCTPQIFPGLGHKDESYWSDALKKIIRPAIIPMDDEYWRCMNIIYPSVC